METVDPFDDELDPDAEAELDDIDFDEIDEDIEDDELGEADDEF